MTKAVAWAAFLMAALALWRFGELASVVQSLVVIQQSDNIRLEELEAARR